ncbi:MAG: hypothetical protein KBD53_03485 [Candidatus Omnitrophica bacterium]|nr:hypothetical protein [Candidatus Omnitrophota bacterium]
MLITKNVIKNTVHNLAFLLIFISIITFHTDTLAATNKKLYDQYRELGIQEQQKGNFNAALSYFSKAVSLGTEDPAIFNDIGVIYEQMGLLGKAEKQYALAIKKDKNYLPSYSNMAMMYLNNGYPDKAFPYFKKRYELSKLGDEWGQKAKEEMMKIKPEYFAWFVRVEAEKLNKEIVEQNHKEFMDRIKRANEHYLKGVEYVHNEELKPAIDEFDFALNITPDNPKIIQARKDVMKVISKNQVKEQMDLAARHLEEGDSYSAKRELQKILANFPDEYLLNSN